MQNGIKNIEKWQNSLGLYPLRLFNYTPEQFILLNGGNNSFCIDFKNELNKEKYLNYSWSSDVESFINFDNKKVFVYRWDKNNVEEYEYNNISENLNLFYKYLGLINPTKENSIINFIMKIFRQLQNLLEKTDGKESLKALLYLLAATNEDSENFDLDKWGLEQINKDIITTNKNDALNILIKTINNGITSRNLKPDLNLILRHSSGRLFQEAHFEAILNTQTQLWDLPATKVKSDTVTNKGVYFTPSFLTRSIVEECLKYFENKFPETITIFDPACGSGEFLKEAIRQLRINNFKGKIICIGWDISTIAIDMAKFILNFEKNDWGTNNIEINLTTVIDSLLEKWPDNVNLLLMNPPYISWENLEENQRNVVREILDLNYKKNPNLASAFLWKAYQSLNEDNIFGCVIPSSLLNADSYNELRETLVSNLKIKLIGKLGSYLFYGALTDASIIVAKKSNSNTKNQTTILWAKNELHSASDAIRGLRIFRNNNLLPISEKTYSVYNINLNSSHINPISYKSYELRQELEKRILSNSLVRIKDIFQIRQGVRTGKNSVFLIDKLFHSKLSSDEKKYFRPAITNQAINYGRLKIVDYIWYPYGEELKEITRETDLQKTASYFYQYRLKPNRNFLKNRKEVTENKYKWWDLTRERKWLVQKSPKIVSTEFGNAGSFAFDKKGDFIIERGHGWLPKKDFTDDMYYAYIAIFNCNFFNELLYIYSKQISSNSWYLSSKFCHEIPIPNLFILFNTQEFTKLKEIGKKLSLGQIIDYKNLYEIILQLFGIKNFEL
ncbi:MAG: N-6 DNA methylase [Ignavibacteria bacterium]|nr:N-6 DNA methylase [Ignavibacteria bacterium]